MSVALVPRATSLSACRDCAPGPGRLSTETARGCDLETLRQMGGWSNDTMLMTYTHLAADDLKRAHATRSPLDNL